MHDLNSIDELSANWYSMLKQGANYKLSENFKLYEFQSGDGEDVVLMHPQLLVGLELVRLEFDSSVTINSGYRTRNHNEDIEGSIDSRHCLGLASDIVVSGVSPDDVAEFAKTLDFGGVGYYNTFTHLDVWGFDRSWDKRS